METSASFEARSAPPPYPASSMQPVNHFFCNTLTHCVSTGKDLSYQEKKKHSRRVVWIRTSEMSPAYFRFDLARAVLAFDASTSESSYAF